MIKEVEARSLLTSVKYPDPWFGLKYNLNLYRGCQHQCIYCDSRSECYHIDNFNEDVLVKINAIDLLRRELTHKRVKGTIGFGAMNDPYMPLESQQKLTRRALEVISEFQFPVHIITKSDMVLRDIDLYQQIRRTYCAISMTVTTTDDLLAKIIEPGAPLPSQRMAAVRSLSQAGILTGITLMPVLPFIEDNEDNIRAVLTSAAENGAKYILLGLGMSIRDRQRDYFYNKLDLHFPGLRQRYQSAYGDRYNCPVPNARSLEALVNRLCRQLNLLQVMPVYQPPTVMTQPGLF